MTAANEDSNLPCGKSLDGVFLIEEGFAAK
jgi:hypothetical protein